MKSSHYKFLLGIVLLLTISFTWANSRIMIKFKPDSTIIKGLNDKGIRAQLMQPLTIDKIQLLSKLSGEELQDIGPLAIGGRVVATKRDLNAAEMTKVINTLNTVPGVEYAEEDKIVHSSAALNPRQWNMLDKTLYPSLGIYYGNSFAPNKQFVTNKGAGVTVAVIDSGYIPHPNFLPNLIASPGGGYGYNFITDCRINATCSTATPKSQSFINPQSDALDNGSWITKYEYDQAESDFKLFCGGSPFRAKDSSWHGTLVTGTIIGQGYNGFAGVLGGAYEAKVLPVKVMGKCDNGYYSDILNGMLWAIDAYPTIPNPSPAQVLNLSLSGIDKCSKLEQNVIDFITQYGAIVVAAAGNGFMDVSGASPASCNNVISVAAASPKKSLAFYSNYGNVTITAVGGDVRYNQGMVLSTFYDSETSYDDCTGNRCFVYAFSQGTSMAAPHVSATVADLLSINPYFTYDDVKHLLQDNADNLINNCSESGCVPKTSFLNVSRAENAALQETHEILYTVGDLGIDVISVPLSDPSALQVIKTYSQRQYPYTLNQTRGIAIESANSMVYILNSSLAADGNNLHYCKLEKDGYSIDMTSCRGQNLTSIKYGYAITLNNGHAYLTAYKDNTDKYPYRVLVCTIEDKYGRLTDCKAMDTGLPYTPGYFGNAGYSQVQIYNGYAYITASNKSTLPESGRIYKALINPDGSLNAWTYSGSSGQTGLTSLAFYNGYMYTYSWAPTEISSFMLNDYGNPLYAQTLYSSIISSGTAGMAIDQFGNLFTPIDKEMVYCRLEEKGAGKCVKAPNFNPMEYSYQIAVGK